MNGPLGLGPDICVHVDISLQHLPDPADRLHLVVPRDMTEVTGLSWKHATE